MVWFRGAKMKKTVFLSSMLLFPFFVDAAASGVDFELKSTPVPDALSVFYTQILKKPFRLSPDVVAMTNKNVYFTLCRSRTLENFLLITWLISALNLKQKMVSISTMYPLNQQKKQFCRNSATPINPCTGLSIICHRR